MFNIEEQLKMLPDKPGVYIMHDVDDRIIYVGKAVNLKNRVRSYFRKTDKTERIKRMVSFCIGNQNILQKPAYRSGAAGIVLRKQRIRIAPLSNLKLFYIFLRGNHTGNRLMAKLFSLESFLYFLQHIK